MAIDSAYVQQMATQLATYEVQGAESRAQRNKTNYSTQLSSLTSLDSALKTFKSAVYGLKSNKASMLINSGTFSKPEQATATLDGKAAAGTYQFFVEQLASSHQLAFGQLRDGDVAAGGSLTLGQDGKSFTVDLGAADKNGDGTLSLAELSEAINSASDNTGVKSTVVRSNGEVTLVLNSEKSGEAQAISVAVSGNAALATAADNRQELSVARDARVRLGGEGGMLLQNSSNTFENLMEGVNITFNQVHASGEQPLTFTVERDDEATQAKLKTFIDAYNTLAGVIDGLTGSGGEAGQRGALASDSTVRAIDNSLNQMIRATFDGKSLIDFGVSADRDGKLTLDAARFQKAVAAEPEAFEKLFTGKDSLIDSLDKNIAMYTNSGNGLLKARKDNLGVAIKRVEKQFDDIDRQYEQYYSRYLKQYTNLMQIQISMEQTGGMF